MENVVISKRSGYSNAKKKTPGTRTHCELMTGDTSHAPSAIQHRLKPQPDGREERVGGIQEIEGGSVLSLKESSQSGKRKWDI